MEGVEIHSYDPSMQGSIDRMMTRIQAEFAEAITGPSSVKMRDAYQRDGHHFIVAMREGQAVGTAGVISYDGFAVLVRMMVDPSCRGPLGISRQLLDLSLKHAKENKTSLMYLGTMRQFIAAQRFYEKNGFTRIEKSDLPAAYAANPIDDCFYSRTLAG